MFVAYVLSDKGRAVLGKAGFGNPDPPVSGPVVRPVRGGWAGLGGDCGWLGVMTSGGHEGVEFRLLGDVEVWCGGRWVDGGPARQRCVLVALLVDLGRVVSVEQLIGRVWGDQPPQRSREVVYSYVSRLRSVLADSGVGIERQRGGYAVVAAPEAVDLFRFHQDVALAKSAADDAAALEAYDRALGRWRGDAFGGVDSVWLQARRERLRAERLAVELDRNEVVLRSGEPGSLVGRVTELAAEHPLDERIAVQLMRALFLSGRVGDALAAARSTRRRLTDELGVDPGEELRRWELAVLRREADSAVGAGRRTHATPRQLPADAAAFTGRRAEVDRVLARAEVDGVLGVAVDGMAGVGKTTLAVHVAHRLAPRFADGQLFLDLRGHSEDGAALTPADVLDVLLRAVGVAGERVPPTVEERAGLWRSRLAGRAMLVVLDNAVTDAQVRPLLPGTPGSLVLVTSRSMLADLDGVDRISLGPPLPAEASELFLRAAGHRYTDAEPGLVREVVELCGRLPLAIGIAAARWRTRPSWTLADLRDRLVDPVRRTVELRVGQRSVEAAFRLSYRQLTTEHRHLFRRLGLHPGPDTDVHAAAEVAGIGAAEASSLLEDLVDAHLLLSPRSGRYRFHDLVRVFAATVAGEQAESERLEASARLADHYLRAAAHAMDVCHPYDSAFRPRLPASDVVLATRADAERWLDDELGNLVAVAAHCTHPHLMGATLALHLEVGRHTGEAERVHSVALAAATLAGDRRAETRALTDLGRAYYRADRQDAAATTFAAALRLARELGDRWGEATALTGVASVHAMANRLAEAEAHFAPALALARELGDGVGEQRALNGLGFVHNWRGEMVAATARCRESLAVARDIGDRHGEVSALTRLGSSHLWTGVSAVAEAAEWFHEAFVLARELGDRHHEATSLIGLADTHATSGDDETALEYHQRALVIVRDIGDRFAEAYALRSVADLLVKRGDAPSAGEYYRSALAVARDVGDRRDELHALRGLGWVEWEAGHPNAAVDHLDRAMNGARDFGDSDLEAWVLCVYGEVLRHGDPPEATALLQRANCLARTTGNRVAEFHSQRSLGLLELAAGRPAAALVHFDTAAEAVAAVRRRDLADLHYQLARTHHAMGEDEPADRHWGEALRVHAEIAEPRRS